MKKLLFAFSLFVGGIIAVNAQDTTSVDQSQQQYPTTQDQDQDRQRINSQDLPDAVKRSLEGQEYRGCLINAPYKTSGTGAQGDDQSQNQNQSDTTDVSGDQTGNQSQEVYVVELKNGAQTKTVRFDKDGQKLDDGGMNQDDQK